VLEDLGFLWFEEPLNQWGGYRGYELLNRSMTIALAGGEVTMGRNEGRDLIDRRGIDIYQPDPVIIGGIGDLLSDHHVLEIKPHAERHEQGTQQSG